MQNQEPAAQLSRLQTAPLLLLELSLDSPFPCRHLSHQLHGCRCLHLHLSVCQNAFLLYKTSCRTNALETFQVRYLSKLWSLFTSVIHATATFNSIHHVRGWAQRTGAGGQARFGSQVAVPSQHPHIAGCRHAQHSPLPQHGGYIKVWKCCLRFDREWYVQFLPLKSPCFLFFLNFLLSPPRSETNTGETSASVNMESSPSPGNTETPSQENEAQSGEWKKEK